MPVGHKSGYLGTVTWGGVLLDDVISATVTRNPNTQSTRTSSTAGKLRRVRGGYDKGGTIVIARDGFEVSGSPVNEGDQATVTMTSDGSQVMFTGLAYVDTIEQNIDVNTGAIVSTTVRWLEQAP